MQFREDALLAWVRQLVRQHGMAPMTAAVTAAGVLMSQALAVVVTYLWGAEEWAFALFLSTLAPLVFLPPMSWMVFGLVRRLHVTEDKLQRLAQIDPVTGVVNRRHFTQLARAALLMAYRYQHALALMLIDLDGLKRVNDQCGVRAGDEVMARVARLCREALRDSDIFARFAGDEFVAALPHADPEAASATAERLRQLVEQLTIDAGGTALKMTVSIGVAATPKEHNASLQDLFALADDALRRAKVRGGNRTETATWTPEAHRPDDRPSADGCGAREF